MGSLRFRRPAVSLSDVDRKLAELQVASGGASVCRHALVCGSRGPSPLPGGERSAEFMRNA